MVFRDVDADMCAVIGYCSLFGAVQVAARPSSQTAPHYLAVSEEISTQVNRILTGALTVPDALKQLTAGIQRAMGVGSL